MIHAAEAAKLAFDAVVIAVVVGIAGHKPVAADVVIGFDLFHNVDRKSEPGDPRPTGLFVCKIELGMLKL